MEAESDRKKMEEKVREDVNRLLKKFAEQIKGFDDSKVPFFIERDKKLREPSENNDGADDFRQRMLKNAPEQDGDYIIAEKKGWK